MPETRRCIRVLCPASAAGATFRAASPAPLEERGERRSGRRGRCAAWAPVPFGRCDPDLLGREAPHHARAGALHARSRSELPERSCTERSRPRARRKRAPAGANRRALNAPSTRAPWECPSRAAWLDGIEELGRRLPDLRDNPRSCLIRCTASTSRSPPTSVSIDRTAARRERELARATGPDGRGRTAKRELHRTGPAERAREPPRGVRGLDRAVVVRRQRWTLGTAVRDDMVHRPAVDLSGERATDVATRGRRKLAVLSVQNPIRYGVVYEVDRRLRGGCLTAAADEHDRERRDEASHRTTLARALSPLAGHPRVLYSLPVELVAAQQPGKRCSRTRGQAPTARPRVTAQPSRDDAGAAGGQRRARCGRSRTSARPVRS